MPNGKGPSTRALQSTQDTENTIRINVEDRAAVGRSADASQRLSVLGEMTGGIAHDFRNILAVIESGLRLAQLNSSDPEKVRTFVAGAREGVARGLELISQLLTFAKQGELHPSAVDANVLLQRLELFLKYGAGSRVSIKLDLSPSIPDCFVDPSQFNAAILNLVINARDAMPNGGKIEISTSRLVRAAAWPATSRAYVCVRVKDNGSGMTKQVVEKIFEPFFTTKGEKGTGLGIPQVNAFMRHIGGHVGVASELGVGTTFDLFFPAVESENHSSGAGKMLPSEECHPSDQSATNNL